jgi:hypothetical protein
LVFYQGSAASFKLTERRAPYRNVRFYISPSNIAGVSALKLDIEAERQTVVKIEEFLRQRDFNKVCFESGKFIEDVAVQIYNDIQGSQPRSAKVAIDFLIDKELVSRPLGFKFHVARELRNVEAHSLPYPITAEDVAIAIDSLNRMIEWLHQGNLLRDWQTIIKNFEEGVELLCQHGKDEIMKSVRMIYGSLHDALDLKIRSLKLDAHRQDFFSSVQLLAKHGLDVRSEAWKTLTMMRNELAHGSSGSPEFELGPLRLILPDLRDILKRLNPLDQNAATIVDYPQVSFNKKLIAE